MMWGPLNGKSCALTQAVIQVDLLRDVVVCDMGVSNIVVKAVILKGLFFDIVKNAFARRLQSLGG